MSGPVQALLARRARASFDASPVASPYGAPRPTLDQTTGLPLLELPPYFKYASFGWTGDLMRDGLPTPPRHDGMGVVRTRGSAVVLVRNHEDGVGTSFIGRPGDSFVYDDVDLFGLRASGGTTTLVWDRVRGWRRAQASLGGTVTNCAGGITPWGSWLTCEETLTNGEIIGGQRHGYVFEVAPFGQSTAQPIRDMGLMAHEAAAVDARTGIVYETEDEGPNSGFYRYFPNATKPRRGQLERGGVLQMLGVAGAPGIDLRRPAQGEQFPVVWADVPEPDRYPRDDILDLDGPSMPYLQGRGNGGARFARLEGCFYDPFEGTLYFVDTSGGVAGQGALWRYTPPEDELSGEGLLEAVFVGSSAAAIDRPDNVVVSPRGGILLCEDGGNPPGTGGGLRLMGITDDGCSYPFAINAMLLDESPPGRPGIAPGDYRGREFAGACFEPAGSTLFVNIQTPGVTFAITGPFGLGPL